MFRQDQSAYVGSNANAASSGSSYYQIGSGGDGEGYAAEFLRDFLAGTPDDEAFSLNIEPNQPTWMHQQQQHHQNQHHQNQHQHQQHHQHQQNHHQQYPGPGFTNQTIFSAITSSQEDHASPSSTIAPLALGTSLSPPTNRAPASSTVAPVRMPTTESRAKRRALNRNNATNSRARQKLKIESMALRVAALEEQNKVLLALCEAAERESDVALENAIAAPQTSERSAEEFSMIESLTRTESHFCITDPRQTDNPITFVSQGFCDMTGYTPAEVVGRNCRFLQGPATERDTVHHMSESLKSSTAFTCTVLNYRKNGTPFWNELHISPLMSADGSEIIQYVGVQREIAVKSIPYSILARVSGNDNNNDDTDNDDDDDDEE